jgi:uncharacterized cupin superfamily protein
VPRITEATAIREVSDDPRDPCGPATSLRLSDTGDLTQFGASVDILPPGSATALRHWHAEEDELVYCLSGVATVHEGDATFTLSPGEAATFKAGVEKGHYVENRGTGELRLLVVGTRAARDTIVYPDHDRVLFRDRGAEDEAEDRFETFDGAPAESPYSL